MATQQMIQQYMANLYNMYRKKRALQSQMQPQAGGQQQRIQPSTLMRQAQRPQAQPQVRQPQSRMPYASGVYDPMATLMMPTVRR